MVSVSQPEFTGQQLFPYTGGTAQGQTVNSASSYVTAAAAAGSGTATVTANLYQTNQPNTTFQLYYTIETAASSPGDRRSPPTATAPAPAPSSLPASPPDHTPSTWT